MVAVGGLTGVAYAAGVASPFARLFGVLLVALPSLRALWVLLPGFGAVDALRFIGGGWSLRRGGRWLAADCVAQVEIHQVGWWLVFRCAGRRRWVWLDMRGDEPGLRREMARALRSATDPWAR